MLLEQFGTQGTSWCGGNSGTVRSEGYDGSNGNSVAQANIAVGGGIIVTYGENGSIGNGTITCSGNNGIGTSGKTSYSASVSASGGGGGGVVLQISRFRKR